ncbi:MAG: hypothetical protein AAF414_15840 [Pseudomonadota bacterium]
MTIAPSQTHGPYRVATIENDVLSVAVVPSYGAKVVELTDKRTGRNWLVTGSPTEADGDDAVFGGREAYGWDECFPTVASCREIELNWAARDHGLLWGRPWLFESQDNSITTIFRHESFSFTRRLSLDGPRLTSDYVLENTADTPFSYLWSVHPLFDLSPGETITLGGVDEVSSTYVSLDDYLTGPGPLAWPSATIGGQTIDLDKVHPSSRRLAAKLYLDNPDLDRVTLNGANGTLALTWKRDQIAALGLWLDYGGWPDGDPVHQVAIEPTTAPADDLATAREGGRQCVLEPGEVHRWWMGMTFEAASDDAPLEKDLIEVDTV